MTPELLIQEQVIIEDKLKQAQNLCEEFLRQINHLDVSIRTAEDFKTGNLYFSFSRRSKLTGRKFLLNFEATVSACSRGNF